MVAEKKTRDPRAETTRAGSSVAIAGGSWIDGDGRFALVRSHTVPHWSLRTEDRPHDGGVTMRTPEEAAAVLRLALQAYREISGTLHGPLTFPASPVPMTQPQEIAVLVRQAREAIAQQPRRREPVEFELTPEAKKRLGYVRCPGCGDLERVSESAGVCFACGEVVAP